MIQTNRVVFQICYVLLFSSAEIAKGIPRGSYGLIFGTNTFLAIFLRIVFNEAFKPMNFKVNDTRFKFLLNFEGGLLAFIGLAYICFILIFKLLSPKTESSDVIMSSNAGQI